MAEIKGHIHIVNIDETPKMPYSDEQIKALLDGIYEGSVTDDNLPEELYFAIADYLKEGVYKGFGGDLSDFKGKPDFELLTELRENIYMFSSAKTFQQVKDISSQLVDGDRIRTQSEFQKIGRETFETWNDDWGRSEYVTAISSASMASKWQDIERNKDILPNLSYSTSGGDVCDICAPLDGLTAPVDDPVWDDILSPNHFNCMCIITQEDADAELTPEDDKGELHENATDLMEPCFIMNSGKDKVIFDSDHSYFDIAKKDKSFAEENFGLPIPSVEQEIGIPQAAAEIIPPAMVEPPGPDEVAQTGLTLDHAKEVMQHLDIPEDQADAIKTYTKGNYNAINGYLRGWKSEISKENQEVADNLDAFLKKSPKVTAESYRGMTLEQDEYNKLLELKKGSAYLDKGYMSTSFNETVAKDFEGDYPFIAHITIEGKSGTLIEHFSDAKKEHEILFGRETNFLIKSIKKEEKKIKINGVNTVISGKIFVSLIEI